jgi:branched-subunit amino acid transport protein AzlD
MVSTGTALGYTVVFGGIIFLCRALPFILFKKNNEEGRFTKAKQAGGNKTGAFLDFVERAVPAAAMTVLAFNALFSPVKEAVTSQPPSLMGIIPLVAAALVTAILHVWKRNPLVSIIGGTALYMILERLLGTVSL